MGEDDQRWSALVEREFAHHRGTADWPGPLPAQVPAWLAWVRLGRPHLLQLSLDDGQLTRAWVTPRRGFAQDHTAVPAGLIAQLPPPAITRLLLPEPLLAELARAGRHTELLVVAGAQLRGIAYPMLPVAGGELLNAYAGVTVLPSLSWGVHLLERSAVRAGRQWVGYLNPTAGFTQVSDLMAVRARRQRAQTSADLPALRAALGDRRHGLALIASHASLTDDGSVDLRDHLGNRADPTALAGWPLPPVTVLAGCRTGASNSAAPLHLAEAALIAGANHVIVTGDRTGEEFADEVLHLALWLMHRCGMTTALALQSALQRFARMYPHAATRPLGSIMHVGLPGCAEGSPHQMRAAAPRVWLSGPRPRGGPRSVRAAVPPGGQG